MNVEGNVKLGNTLRVKASQQGGGNIRIIPRDNGNASSVGYYSRGDARATEAGDVWVCGLNSWGLSNYIIGTSGTGNCLNINSDGRVAMSNGLQILCL